MPEEREKLRKWMGTVRWTYYNKVLGMVQDDGITGMSIIQECYLNNKQFTEEFSWEIWSLVSPKKVTCILPGITVLLFTFSGYFRIDRIRI
ncbi:unnamed protein product [Rhizophagus irregularis]|nr:unnamed protein product [Rhizophagus irregularis]CAB4435120.1 unnamed protein product [Rhizophagus irregularis]